MPNLEPVNKSKITTFADEIRPNAIWDVFKWLGGALMQTSIASGLLIYLTALPFNWLVVAGLFTLALFFMAIPYWLSRRKTIADFIRLEQLASSFEQEKIKQVVETSERQLLEKTQELQLIIQAKEEKIKDLETAHKLDPEKPLTKVIGRKFSNEKVVLDGHYYTKCEFTNVTFVYNGTAYADLFSNDFKGCAFASENVSIGVASAILYGLGYIKPDVPMLDAESGEVLKFVKPPNYS